MNRQIKFRAWSKELQIFLPNDEWFLDFGGNLCFYSFDYEDGWRIERDADKNLYVIQQFTGLKDKNGAEIYEGDILKLYYTDPLIGFIKFCYGASSLSDGEWRIEYAKWVLVKHNSQEYENSYHLSSQENREIIGNIFQNPELLENK